MYRTTALFVLTALLGAHAAEERVAVPPAAEVEKATKLVRALFKDDYAKTAPKAKLALAEKLFKQAEETKDDPAAQFVLYRETADLAAAAGDVTLTLRALDATQARFAGIKPDHAEPTLKALAAKASAADALTLATYLLKTVDEAVTADQLDAAERLARLAETTAVKSKNVRTASAAAARVKEVEAFKKEAETVKAALKTLELTPTDPAASAVAGRYYCFQKGDWEKGLPLLVAGDDAKLKDVAKQDAANPKDAADVLAVGDAWYDLGKAATAAHQRRAMLARAFAFYTRAVPDLAGLTRTRAEKRVEELEKVVEVRGAGGDDLWSAVRAAVRAGDVEELPAAGGVFGAKEYREAAPDGGALIGFHYATGKARNSNDIMVVYLQPIYMTAGGEKLGTAYGKAPAKTQTAKAKAGYAVGAIKIYGGAQLEGCTLTFMKVQGRGLNAAEKYDAPVMGRDTAPGTKVLGDGRPVVGLHGKLLDGDGDICTIGLLLAGGKLKK